MDIQWWEVMGLIGVVLVITAGRIFEPLRDWLMGFDKKTNVMRLLGELLSCSMCCGVWIGFLWAFFVEGASWTVALIFGGCISIAALVADELVGIISLYRLLRAKKNQGSMTMEEMLAARQQAAALKKQRKADQMAQARARRRGTPRELTEDEADAYADAQEEAVDKLILGEPDEAA
jgi:hypothetical protein